MPGRTWVVLGIVYALLVALGITGLVHARTWVLATYDTPSETEKWNDFRQAISEGQNEGHSPVKRRTPGSQQPPIKILFSENFAAIVIWSIVFLSILYWSVGIMMVGALRTPSHVPASDDDAPH
ncbi:hypothetical protein [Bremerella cremea]|uniref:hypothetical protein n=1 Tax=Bremerella cremea TaxID=1031537 RepID=UPI0031EDAA49